MYLQDDDRKILLIFYDFQREPTIADSEVFLYYAAQFSGDDASNALYYNWLAGPKLLQDKLMGFKATSWSQRWWSRWMP